MTSPKRPLTVVQNQKHRGVPDPNRCSARALAAEHAFNGRAALRKYYEPLDAAQTRVATSATAQLVNYSSTAR